MVLVSSPQLIDAILNVVSPFPIFRGLSNHGKLHKTREVQDFYKKRRKKVVKCTPAVIDNFDNDEDLYSPSCLY